MLVNLVGHRLTDNGLEGWSIKLCKTRTNPAASFLYPKYYNSYTIPQPKHYLQNLIYEFCFLAKLNIQIIRLYEV
jgi:hypothetical protein